MKRKIGEIYNKPIVIGDKNLVTRNEIHESELNASTGGGDAPSGSDIRYIRASNNDGSWVNLILYATLVAAEFDNGDKGVIPPMLTRATGFSIKEGKGLAFCWDAEIKMQGQTAALGEGVAQLFNSLGVEPEYLTKEEFYNLVA